MFRYLLISTILMAGLGGSAISAQPGAPKPVLTESVDEPGRSPYQEAPAASCTGGVCSFTFLAVPAGKRLVITYISLYAPVQNGNGVPYVALYNPSNNLAISLPVISNIPASDTFSTQVTIFGGFIQFYVEAGQNLAAAISLGDIPNPTPHIFISGYYISL